MNDDLMTKAQIFAGVVHAGQLYGPSDKPYTYHLEKVVECLIRFGVQEKEILVAGWLHDTLEDTDTTLDTLHVLFGSRVAALVNAVTDGTGATRTARKQRPYRLIPTCPGAVCLKLADRIANLEASIGEGHHRLLDRYAKEHPGFQDALYDGSHPAMWMYLDHLFEIHGYAFQPACVVQVDSQGDSDERTTE